MALVLQQKMSSPATQCDVAIVGAGAAGLRAAVHLTRKGLNVVVLEARNRVGGRTYTKDFAGVSDAVDLGGQWLGPTQYNAQELVKEFGMKLHPQFDDGKHVLELGGKFISYSGNLSELKMFTSDEEPHSANASLSSNSASASSTDKRPELERVWAVLDELAFKLNMESTTTEGHGISRQLARELDQMSFAQWSAANIRGKQTMFLVNWFVRVCLAVEPTETSALYVIWWLRAGGGYERLANIHGGAQQDTLLGGAQQLSERMAQQLKPGALRLNSAVTMIKQDAQGVTLWYRNPNLESGNPDTSLRSVRAKRVIIAVAPALCDRIQFSPALPPLRVQLQQRMPMGCVIKVNVFYPRPFWRDLGMSAEIISDKGPIAICYDKTIGGKAAIVGFICGGPAREWGLKTQEERKAAVVAQFARVFGEAALKPSGYIDHYWSTEDWSAGCYFGVPIPGVFSQCGKALREPIGRLHFAGTETARVWIGYIDGALESGIRAADEVVTALQNEKSNTHLRSKL